MILMNYFYFLQVTYPWNDEYNHAFSGIPPHIAILQEIAAVRSEHKKFVSSFLDRVKAALSSYGVNSGHLTEERLNITLQGFLKDIEVHFQRLEGHPPRETIAERIEKPGTRYELHVYGGSLHRLPADWRIPRCGVHGLWRQWWIGDDVRQIPPLRILTIKDLKHLEKIPLSDVELQRKVGKNKANRRDMTKVLCDMKFLMNHITTLVTAAGLLENEITLSSVDHMFQAVSGRLILSGVRDSQKMWMTVVREVRTKIKEQQNN
jgi:hypothetical protein